MDAIYFIIIFSCIQPTHAVVPDYFYPFGPDQGDNVVPANDDGSSGEVDISVQFPFFDQLHSSLYVNINGVVSFLTQVILYTPDAFPLGDNRRLIAPFWADVDTTENDGAIYYRETQDPSILSKVTTEVRDFFVNQPHFQAQWTFIATWNRVTYYGGGSHAPVNTFQVVLTTNGRHSFAIFNYGQITWTHGTTSDETPAQVGFNAGDGIRSYSVPGSCTPAISDIELTTNIGQPGRWVFQVDETNVESGGCKTEDSVVLGSRFSPTLGGKLIHVSGPCFNISKDDVVCDFDGVMVQGEVITATRAACVSPAPFTLGKRPFRLSVDGGNTFDYNGDFWFVEEYSIVQVNPPAWLELDLFQDLQIEWDPDLLTSTTVSVNFVTFNMDVDGNVEMIEVPLISSTINTGSFQIPDILENTDDLQLANFGAIRITEIGVPSQRTQSLWSPISPAVWYTNRYMYTVAIYGPNVNALATCKHNTVATASQAWKAITNFVNTTAGNVREAVSEKLLDISDDLFEDNCNDWHAAEQANPPDLSDVPIPPCTMEQATHDPNFKPESVCNMGQGLCNFFHNGAFHCVHSVNPSPSGASQQACYNQEGQLLPFDNGGGTYDRAHTDGHPDTGKWKVVNHFVEDVLPFFYCCKLSRDHCGKYGEVRPTIPCDGYDPPQPAWTGGDPHISTLDGVPYTFNGVGEYWLIKTKDQQIQMQGRAGPIMSGSGSASIWTALAMKISTSNTVQVQTNERSGLETMIDGNRVDFEERMSWVYDGVTVTASVGTTQVKVQFLDGSEVKVIHVDGSLSFQMMLAQMYKGQTHGLLGVWNDDKTDDLLAPDGTTIDINSYPRDMYDFGNKWRITEAESLFEYPAGSYYDSFQDLSFTPTLDLSMDKPDAVRLCGSSIQCKFDYLVTGSTSIAEHTKKSMLELAMVRKDLQPVVTCGFPSIPENGFGNATNGPAGVAVRFQCNPGFKLTGSACRTCQDNGQWSGQAPQCTGSGTKAVTMGLPVFLVMIAVSLNLILPLKD